VWKDCVHMGVVSGSYKGVNPYRSLTAVQEGTNGNQGKLWTDTHSIVHVSLD